MVQTKHYVFTLNNYTQDDIQRLRSIQEACAYIIFGKEVGNSGTPHLQGYVCFKQVKTFLQAKNLIGTRAHIERKRGSPKEAADYCMKENDYEEFGVLPTTGGSDTKFKRFVEWVENSHAINLRVPSEREIAVSFPDMFVMYGSKLRALAKHHCPHPILETALEWRPWQTELRDELMQPCTDNRAIVFYVDEEGGHGKSWFQRVFISMYEDRVQLLSSGKRDDIAFAVDEHKDIFLFNIARGQMEYLNYSVLEMLKDRMVFSSKYNSQMKILTRVPHVIVFCNEEPDYNKMTNDRFVIRSEF